MGDRCRANEREEEERRPQLKIKRWSSIFNWGQLEVVGWSCGGLREVGRRGVEAVGGHSRAIEREGE
jgi:hypothetical protein